MTKYLILFLLKLKILLLIFKKSTKTQTGGSLRRTEVSLLSPLLGLLTSIFHDWCQAAKDGTDLCQIHISQVWQSQCWRRGQKSGIHRLWKRGGGCDGRRHRGTRGGLRDTFRWLCRDRSGCGCLLYRFFLPVLYYLNKGNILLHHPTFQTLLPVWNGMS